MHEKLKKSYTLFLVLFGLIINFEAFAGLSDTLIKVSEVTVCAQKRIHSSGVKIEKIDSEKLNNVASGGLGSALSKYTPFYIKSYSSGFSTISMRGMTADHVAVYSDDINLNSLTLGHSNLSKIPMYFFDAVEVQYGGSSSIDGTDAMAGSIHMYSDPKFNKGVGLQADASVASFENYFGGVKFRIGNDRLESSTKVFYKEGKNNFPFLNTSVKDFETNKFVNDTQRNNAIENYGLRQEFFYKLNRSNNFLLKLNHVYNLRETQPKMNTNYHNDSDEHIENTMSFATLGYDYKSAINKLKFRTSYVDDFQLYNGEDTISTKRIIMGLNNEFPLIYDFKLNFGGDYEYIEPNVHSYDTDISEQRGAIYMLISQHLETKTKYDVNLRQSLNSNYKPFFSPSVGISQVLRLSDINFLKMKGHYSRNYKIPTFNDRYWGTAGNPDLKVESSNNLDVNLQLNTDDADFTLRNTLSGYYSVLKDMIMWFPVSGSIWEPDNRQEVEVKGLEYSAFLCSEFNRLDWEVSLSYSYNLSTVLDVYQENDSDEIGRQLAYTPKHNYMFFVSADFEKWNILIDGHYTGLRYNSNLDNMLDSYFLLNAAIGRAFSISSSEIKIDFVVNNVLDNKYVNMENYAMPGINWQIKLKYKFNNYKN